ncbi:hypothetical protein SCP_0903510 [Sparassis crispa]|uniref:Uncharacterized protein n=1 Tax=Sparassis crispa TaxID=139825 RepID=A0A401GWB1_9APHY|nr:hypothetical protein SCP_0903510 [Sparassis crispa]GBE86472.1 hypothetical protein SCP_0903510 [Sparassis crispa]
MSIWDMDQYHQKSATIDTHIDGQIEDINSQIKDIQNPAQEHDVSVSPTQQREPSPD